VILVGMSIFMLATLVATTHSLPVLIAASAMQGMGTGVGGVMARTLPATCTKALSCVMPIAC
jgi:DHA1 family 2-module integral membrane pump EmrD-like MFS transporter